MKDVQEKHTADDPEVQEWISLWCQWVSTAITQGARGSEHIGSALLQIKMVSPALWDTDRIVVTVLQLMSISVLETSRNYFGR